MLNSTASTKKVVVLKMWPCTVGLRSGGVGAVKLIRGCMASWCNKLGQLIYRKV